MSDEKPEGIDWHHAEQCAKVVCETGEGSGLERTIDWKQGLAIAVGVPLLIMPSIGYFASWLWSAAIIVWGLSVFQGFMQNLAYGELATTFPNASGLPGFAQNVFKTRDHVGKYDKGKLIGGFSAWSYWFAWNPVLAIFAILVGFYLHSLFPSVAASFTEYQLSLIAGVVIFGGMILVNYRGLSSGATVGYILAAFSLLPLIIITLAPYATGDFVAANITNNWLPDTWVWNTHHILILLGIFAMAQWSACAWETAAIYGPEYKNPGSDVPKALFSCGAICLFAYVIVQTTVTGVLGIDGIAAAPIDPMLPVAQAALGDIGSTIAVVMLIAAMTLIIQTAYLGSARAMHSMATEGNLPKIFANVNAHGTPVLAMVFIGLFNLGLIAMGGAPAAILAASAIGYVCANGISLFAYVKAKMNPHLAGLDRPFKAPGGWKNVALLFGLFNIPFCLIGVMYLNIVEGSFMTTAVGVVVLALYIPLWFYSQHESYDAEAAASAQ
ncbi:amino acid transporter [Methanohalophilus levihalophilus]|uniref:APC family permease n=1 Tax=Methanohalophilus levihalophilus TaxID=1431282 RepID=UPI001AE9FF43|nr:APC family permease [Methanohalophilus levihalophilus]MBP2030449.1 amino acid transporter [Methanohalophilus levihalophilus]